MFDAEESQSPTNEQTLDDLRARSLAKDDQIARLTRAYNRRFNNETRTSIHEDVPDESITLVDDEAEGSGAAEEPKKGRGRPRGSDS